MLAAVLVAAASASAQEVERRDTLDSSYVTAVKEKMRNTTQTGLMRLDGEKLRSGIAVFGTPDIIKQLQVLPGVAAGNELMSGLYVHGGDGNDNLFLLDGVPLYNITHFGGLFSSFNTDVVENLDFYKSGFPARYGGRLSSVVDVETSEGNMKEYHGNLSIGLIDGRIHVEGPIVKNETSFNFGLRRSWMDVVTKPALWYANNQNKKNGIGARVDGGYAMTDLNGRITHKFSDRSKLNATLYWGKDNLYAGIDEDDEVFMDMDIGTTWGTLASSLSWNYDFSKELRSKMMAYYSRSGSDVGYGFGVGTKFDDNGGILEIKMSDHNICTVRDAGFKYDFDWFPNASNHVRYGLAAAWHFYEVGRYYDSSRKIPGFDPTTDSNKSGESYDAFEPALYIEDEIFLSYNFTLNAGLRWSMFTCGNDGWNHLEPRAALKWLINKDICAKLSYTRMSQYAHLVTAMYIDLPTNSWMPSTFGAGPMMSDQIAGGIYLTPGPFKINVEGWYKTMDNMLAYNGANAFYPPLVNWEKSFTSGRGTSYGLELETTYESRKFDFSAYYTLGWTWREFAAYSAYPFPDRMDNRHKVNLVGTWRPFKHLSLFFNWNYHSGNRITLPSHVVYYHKDVMSDSFFQSPYNYSLPDYHRLDVGADLSTVFHNGSSLNFNISVYNVYNHLNAAFAILDHDENNEYIGMAYGLVPIIPTISVGYKF